MGVRKSAIGSVIDIALDLPARLLDARDETLVSDVPQADTAEAELAEVRTRTTAALAAVVVARRVLARTRLLDTLGSLGHLLVRLRISEGSVALFILRWLRLGVCLRVLFLQLLQRGGLGICLGLALLLRDGRRRRSLLGSARGAVDEREAERLEQGVALLVGLRRGREDDVEATDLVDGVVVDLREDDLLAHAERVVAAAVELGRQSAEIADTRDRDRDQAIEELVHARAALCHGDADGVALAQLELRDRLARLARVRVLARDGRELLGCRLEDARLRLGVAHAHVDGDLLDLRRLHRARVAEALDQRRLDLVLVLLVQTRLDLCLCHCHQSMSFPLRLATRTRRPSSSRRRPTRVGWLELGSTSITFEMWIGPSASMIPPI